MFTIVIWGAVWIEVVGSGIASSASEVLMTVRNMTMKNRKVSKQGHMRLLLLLLSSSHSTQITRGGFATRGENERALRVRHDNVQVVGHSQAVF